MAHFILVVSFQSSKLNLPIIFITIIWHQWSTSQNNWHHTLQLCQRGTAGLSAKKQGCTK